MATASLLKQNLILKHHELIQSLETKYMDHMNQLWQQKTNLLLAMQQQFVMEIERIHQIEKESAISILCKQSETANAIIRSLSSQPTNNTNSNMPLLEHDDDQIKQTNIIKISSSDSESSDNEPIFAKKRKLKRKRYSKNQSIYSPPHKKQKNNASLHKLQNIRSQKLDKLKPMILCSKLNEKQVDEWLKFTEKFSKCAIVTSQWKPSVTHLVTSCSLTLDDRILRSRTTKYFQCLMSGAYIVCFEWILMCLEQNKFVNEESFELLGDTVALGACKLSRQLRMKLDSHRLFSDLFCFICSKFRDYRMSERIKGMLIMGGCSNVIQNDLPYIEWLKDVEKYKEFVKGKKVCFIYDKSMGELTQKQLTFCQTFCVIAMGYGSVFDAISNYKSLC